MNKESFYFPHDYDAASDPKMQALIGKYGGLGYGIYWRVVEMLHASSEHRLCRKPYLYSAIAKQMLISDEQMLEIITYAVDFCELFETDGDTFWSNRVNKNFEKRAEISEKRSFAGKMSAAAKANAKQISTNVQQNSTSVEQVSTNDDQFSTSVQQNSTNGNKGKEKKGKEIKEEEKKDITSGSSSLPSALIVKKFPVANFIPQEFIKPTVEDLERYCTSRKNNINPQHFFDYHERCGWLTKGGQPIVDWRAAVRTWENNDSSSMTKKQPLDAIDKYHLRKKSKEAVNGNTGIPSGEGNTVQNAIGANSI